MTDFAQAARLARAAHRPDLADQITALAVDVETEVVDQGKRDLYVALRPSTVEYTVERWMIDDLTFWLHRETTVDWGGGDADVWEDLILTEYPLTESPVRAAVLAVVAPEAVPPQHFEHGWSATNTQARLRHDGDLNRLNDQLTAGLLAWTEAVRTLRTLDPRPCPPPVQGGRSL